jgi:hypothetical protein
VSIVVLLRNIFLVNLQLSLVAVIVGCRRSMSHSSGRGWSVHVDGMRLSLNCGHQRACCSSPRWYMSVDSRGGNGNDRRKPKNSEKNLSQCHKSHIDWPPPTRWY